MLGKKGLGLTFSESTAEHLKCLIKLRRSQSAVTSYIKVLEKVLDCLAFVLSSMGTLSDLLVNDVFQVGDLSWLVGLVKGLLRVESWHAPSF